MCAENGRAGFEAARKFLPHAIVSDVRMAGGDGIELLKNVHEANLEPSPAVFLITGFADITPAQAESLGARGMLSKPFNLKQLRELVVDSVSHAKP
jgi:two-component system nitrogen regulation response regulator GlnG